MAPLFASSSQAVPAPQVLPRNSSVPATGRFVPRLVQGLVGGALVLIGRKQQGKLLGRAASAAGFSLLASSVEGSSLRRLFDRRS